jgi:hypothetical protein
VFEWREIWREWRRCRWGFLRELDWKPLATELGLWLMDWSLRDRLAGSPEDVRRRLRQVACPGSDEWWNRKPVVYLHLVRANLSGLRNRLQNLQVVERSRSLIGNGWRWYRRPGLG